MVLFPLNYLPNCQSMGKETLLHQFRNKLAQNDISKQGQSNQKDKNNTIVHSKLKIPLEITYDGNQIIEGNKIQCSSKSNYTSIQTNTLTETNDKYPESLYYARSSHNQINQSRQKIQSIREEDQDLINQLRDQIKQLTQENTYLKKELFDQRQEYKILSSSHQELEKKYIYLQNQIVLPTSSCNSSLIIFQEDKNQQILYDIANNCSSLTKLQSKNSFSYPYNQSSSNQPNKMSFKREASPTNSEQFFQSQNLQYNNRTYISPQINNNQNINNIDHNSQLYNSINFESQLFSSVQPNSTLVNNQNQLQNRDEDYSYKKPNNNSKLDGQSLNLASQIQNKSKVQEEFQNLSHLIFNNQSNLSKLNEQILTNANSQIQLSQRFDTSNQIAHQNEYYSQQKQSAETESQINKQFNSVSPNKPSNNYSQQLDIQEAIKKADEIIRRSHYVPNQINSNELPVKRATTQYVQNTHK